MGMLGLEEEGMAVLGPVLLLMLVERETAEEDAGG